MILCNDCNTAHVLYSFIFIYFCYCSDRDLTALNYIIPPSSDTPYDMLNVIEAVVDEGEYFQIMPDYAKNIVVGFARLDGHTVGVVGNQPNQKAGM